MGQYREGQKLQGSDGNVYVVVNGVPMLQGSTPSYIPPSAARVAKETAEQARKDRNEDRANATQERQAGAAERQARSTEQQIDSQKYNNVLKLRSDFDALPPVKEYRVAIAQLATGLKTKPDATGDNALIYAYAKAMDPGSVVRESEMGMAAAGASVFDSTVAGLKKQFGIEGGGQLPPQIRDRMRREMLNKVGELNRVYSAQRQRFVDDAQAFGIDPIRVVGNHDGDVFRPVVDNYIKEQREDGNDPANVFNNPPETDGAIAPTEGGRRTTFDGRTSRQVDALINAGASKATIDRALKEKGYPTINAVDLAAAKKWMRDNPGKRYYGAQINRTDDLSLWQKAVSNPIGAGAAQWTDAVTAGSVGALGGDDARGSLDAMAMLHPTASAIGAIGGNVLGTVGSEALAAAKAPAALARFAPVAGDAAFGGLYGFNTAPEGQGGWGALKGAGINAAGGFAGRAAGRGIAGLGRSGYVSPVDKALFGAAEGDLSAIRSQFDDATRLKLPLSLADTTAKLRALAGSVTRKSVDARSQAEGIFDPRAYGQADRLVQAIDTHLAPTGDLGQITADATSRARSASKDLYDKAKGYPAPQDEPLNDILRTPAGESAAREAYAIALNKGENPAELSFATGPDGNVIINAQPNWRTLHYMRQGLDSIIEKSRDSVSGKLNLNDPATAGLNDLRSRLSGRMQELNPDFAAADAAYAKFADQGAAAERGYQASGIRVTPEATQRALNSAMPDSLPYYRQGYASSMADVAERTRLSNNPFNAVYGSPSQQAKVAAVFPEGADDFGRVNALEQQMSKTRQEVLGGSPTAGRLQADEQLNGGLGTTALDLGSQLATGGGLSLGSLLRASTRALGDSAKLGIGKKAIKRANEIAPTLFDTNPQAAADYLDELIAKMAIHAKRKELGGQIGGALGGGTLTPLLVGPNAF